MKTITTGESYAVLPLFDQETGIMVGSRVLDRTVSNRYTGKEVSASTREQKTPVLEGQVVIAALQQVGASITPHEEDILMNPGNYSTGEYMTLSEYQWWRVSELGGAVLELELRNFELLYPSSAPKNTEL